MPYSFERPSGGGSSEGPLVWPALDHLRENERLLCIIVPGAEDPSTARIEGADEAASMVEVVTGRSDPKIQEIQTICHMYGTKGTPQFARELRNALSDSRPGSSGLCLTGDGHKPWRNRAGRGYRNSADPNSGVQY